MRLSFEGDAVEAQRYLGAAQQELTRLELRMSTQGQEQGRFAIQITPDVQAFGGVAAGVRSVHIIAKKPLAEGEIAEESVYFEFETSGAATQIVSFDEDGTPAKRYKTAVVGTTFSRPSVGGLGSGLANQIIIEPVLLGGNAADNAATVSRIRRPQHNLLYDEPAHALTNTSHILFESWAPGHSHTGIYFRAFVEQAGRDTFRDLFLHGGDQPRIMPSIARGNRGSYVTHTLRQLSVDMPFGDSRGIRPMREAFVRGEADLLRASGIRTVGDQEFGIVIDAFCQVHVFRTSDITQLNGFAQNVNHVQTQKITMPDWVYQPTQKFTDYLVSNDAGKALIDLPDLDWKFHPDGTKACAVVYERVPVDFAEQYWIDHPVQIGEGMASMTRDQFNLLTTENMALKNRFGKDPAPDYKPTYYQCATGIIEATIDIRTSNSGFAFFVSAATVRRPTTSPYHTVAVDYASCGVTSADGSVGARRGDMVVLGIERYVRTDRIAAVSFFSVRNLALIGSDGSPKEIRAFGARSVSDQSQSTEMLTAILVACDLSTLSFAIKQTYSTGGRHHFGVSVYTLNKYRETLFPATIDAALKPVIVSDAQANARLALSGSGWEFLPLNDLREWDGELSTFRDAVFGYPPNIVPSDSVNAWFTGLSLGLAAWPSPLMDITNPRFSWYSYSLELLDRLMITPFTTFFSHPGGTWALYDQQFIYCRLASEETDMRHDIDVQKLEHVIFDRVHFSVAGLSHDSSFRELYNTAVVGARQTDMQIMPADYSRATFMRNVYNPPNRNDVDLFFLGVNWGIPANYLAAFDNRSGTPPATYIDPRTYIAEHFPELLRVFDIMFHYPPMPLWISTWFDVYVPAPDGWNGEPVPYTYFNGRETLSTVFFTFPFFVNGKISNRVAHVIDVRIISVEEERQVMAILVGLNPGGVAATPYSPPDIGSIADMTMGDLFYQGPGAEYPLDPMQTTVRPITFSSAVLIA
jgi:hypothetical protein